jgi:Uma2 family endonuclease
MSTATGPMTVEEFLALPEVEGLERSLIRGELRERPTMTTRGPEHGLLTVNLGHALKRWLETQPPPRGRAFSGETRIRLRRDPQTIVGADVAYIGPELAATTPRNAKLIDGTPRLVVEIISPSDEAESFAEKIQEYLDAGVPIVWEVNPWYQTILVHRRGPKPALFNLDQQIDAEPELPGFRVPVAELFAD